MIRTAHFNLIAAGFLTISFTTNAIAGDRPLFPNDAPQVVYGEKRQEFGTGWYLRGDMSWSRDKVPSLSADGMLTSTTKATNLYGATLGFGYQLNNWFRADITADWRASQTATRTSAATFSCPIEVRGLNRIADGTPIGIYAVQNQCRSTESAKLQRGVLLANGYFDLGTWSGVTPYVGAGVGVAYGRITGSYDWLDTANNGPYAANLVLPGGYPIIWLDEFGNPAPAHQFGAQSKYRSLSQTKFNFAWALMAGMAIDVSPNAKIDFGYRFLNMGKWANAKSANTSHDFRIGFRYQID